MSKKIRIVMRMRKRVVVVVRRSEYVRRRRWWFVVVFGTQNGDIGDMSSSCSIGRNLIMYYDVFLVDF